MKKTLAVFVAAMFLTGCGVNTGRGEKVGTIIKLAQEGVFNKTWEAEIVRGGMNNGTGAFSTTPLHLTITDPDTVAKAQDAFEKQYEVKVKYVSTLMAPWSSQSQENKFAVDIQPLRSACK